MEKRSVNPSEVDLIERLFQETYERKQGIDYWKWTFQNPYGFINVGMFDENNLVGYYSAQFSRDSAYMQSAMTHPYYQKKGVFMDITTNLHRRVSLLRNYVTLFSNETIRPIHLEKEGYTEAYQVKEYRIPIENVDNDIMFLSGDFWANYDIWRYKNHPLTGYIFDYRGVFSFYEDRIQIIDYHNDYLEKAIELAKFLGYNEGKKFVSFWSELDLENYPYILLPLWKQYKILNDRVKMKDLLANDKLRMGQSDVY